MRKLIQVLSFLAIVNLAAAQPTRTEVTNATAPAEDSKPNSDKVPDVYALDGQFDRSWCCVSNTKPTCWPAWSGW